MDPISDLLAKAIEHHRNGHLPAAELLYRQILQRNPNQPDALHLLGVIAHQSGQFEISIDYIRRAIDLNGETAAACCNLGIAYQALQKSTEAIHWYRRALELKWDDLETHLNLGVALKSLGHQDAAIASYRQALQLNPDCVEALNNLGIEFKDQRQFDDAESYFQRAVELRPDFAEVHNNLGNTLKEVGRLDEAIECYRRAIALKPDYAEAYNNLGNPLKDQGLLDESIACFRRAIELQPANAVAHSNLVYSLNFSPDIDGPALLLELRSWTQRHAAHFGQTIQPHQNDRSPNRRLKIGYVSPDFRDHCQSFFMIPLLAHHDRKNFEIFCYADVARPDWLTKQMRSLADHWREIRHLDDGAVTELVRTDQIDILVDLTMHMAQNRLLAFARRPAPLQVSWLAYPGSTGMNAIDYRFSDPYLDPPGLNDHHYSEQTICLRDTFWCYDPLAQEPGINPLPALQNGYITFGCLNNFCKVNRDVVATWARVLHAVRDSRLMILTGAGDHRRELRQQFDSLGIAPERIQLVPPKPRLEYLHYYHSIDLCLDTFPYNGHTTSLDGFWMGVPVVTLVGDRVVGRAGLSQLTNLGLTELIAETRDEFIRIAVLTVSDLPRLSQLRSSLRETLRASPLMDAPRFARQMEQAFQQVWNNWRQTRVDLPDPVGLP